MRNILLFLILCPTIALAEFDIKSLLRLPKQMDSEVKVNYKHVTNNANLYQGSTKLIDRELTTDTINLSYYFGLFDDFTLLFNFNKHTKTQKEAYLNHTNGLVQEYKWSGFSDPKFGGIARIKDGTKSSIFMDVLFNVSPGVFDREFPSPKVSSNSGFTVGKPGNNGNGGHIIEAGVNFGKPMDTDWEWQAKVLYTLRFEADEIDQSNNTRGIVSSHGSYLLSFRAQKFLQENQHTLWAELSYQQASSYKKRTTTGGTVQQYPTLTTTQLLVGAKTSLLWTTFYGGIFGGYGFTSDIDGYTNNILVKIKDQKPKTVGFEFLVKI